MGHTSAVIAVIKKVQSIAEQGVEYTSYSGAICPICGLKTKIITTKPWDDGARVRYHKCLNDLCVLRHLNMQIKSVEMIQIKQQ